MAKLDKLKQDSINAAIEAYKKEMAEKEKDKELAEKNKVKRSTVKKKSVKKT
jgi:hypothetical protein